MVTPDFAKLLLNKCEDEESEKSNMAGNIGLKYISAS